ncbi:tetratricopeptide repeat protein [Shimia biformata]|uniref:tetratricopeptide repeat protein n=1 Tax=Shimia biformata TaxID=1294299 RepID=UPI001EF26594|nr:tetratricopeptide repeat protein [Shimia biformata]
MISLLAACNSGGLSASKDSPYAPDVDSSGQSVDGMVVGHRLMASGQYELALEAFYRAAANNGIDAEVLSAIGTANLSLGRLGQAEDNLRDALDHDERSPQAWNNLGVILVEKGEIPEAVQCFERAFALDNGESDSIRDNLRLALAKMEKAPYDEEDEQEYKLVRRGGSDYLIRKAP